MDILFELIPHIVTLVVAVGVAVSRTTSNKLDDKIAQLAKDNKASITNAIRSLAKEEGEKAAKARK